MGDFRRGDDVELSLGPGSSLKSKYATGRYDARRADRFPRG